jgi:hypothetical protein
MGHYVRLCIKTIAFLAVVISLSYWRSRQG